MLGMTNLTWVRAEAPALPVSVAFAPPGKPSPLVDCQLSDQDHISGRDRQISLS
jgi:hypothetical protein